MFFSGDRKNRTFLQELQSEVGFSIISSMVSVVIVGIMVLSMSHALTSASKGIRGTTQSSELNRATAMIQMIINDEALCDGSFQNADNSKTLLPAPVGENSFALVNKIMINNRQIMATGSTLANGLQITGLTISESDFNERLPGFVYNGGTYTKYVVSLRIQANRGTNAYGGQYLSRSIGDFTVLTDGASEIVICYGENGGLSMLTICGLLGGAYNAGTQTCTPLIEARGTDPSTPQVGQMWLRTDIPL